MRLLGPQSNGAWGVPAIASLVIVVKMGDIGAYSFGRLLGRHKMTPRLSPGKTWEGFVLGAAAGVLTSFFTLYSSAIAPGWRGVAFGGAVVVAATAGDLFESLVKRDLGVKDTGRVLLGHGGVLDRVDSLLFAAPAAYFALLALGKL